MGHCLFIELLKVGLSFFFRDIIRHQVAAATSFVDGFGHMTPGLDGLESLHTQIGLLFGQLEILCLLINLVDALRHDLGGVLDASKLGAQQVLLSAGERRVRVDLGVEVAGEELLELLRKSDVNRLHVRQLDPVADQVGRDPEDGSVDALTALLLLGVPRRFLLEVEDALGNPVVSRCAEDLAKELQLRGTAELG